MTEWKKATYGSVETVSLAPGLSLSVHWEGIERLQSGEPHYNVTVFGLRLKNRSATPEEGKARAIAFARRKLQEALEALDELEARSKDSDL